MDKVFLKKSKLLVSRFGLGVLPMGPSQKNLTIDEGKSIIRYGIDLGLNLIDTAEYYNTYKYIYPAITKEDSIVISSKSLAKTYNDMTKAIDSALKELDRDYIDIFYMHELRSGQFIKREDSFKALIDAKKEGKIRAIGISTHHTDVVKFSADLKDLDVILALINKDGMGIRTGLNEEEINMLTISEKNNLKLIHNSFDKAGTLKEMEDAIKYASNKKDIISMKTFGGGNMVNNYISSLDYIVSNKNISSTLIGFTSKTEIDDLLNYLNHKLDKDFVPNIKEKVMHVNKDDCEGCMTCAKMCASNAISFDEMGLATIDNSKCLTCGYCAKACPVRAIVMY